MIGSTGLFQGILCPYENDCTRPNCHYFHPPEEDSQSQLNVSQFSQYGQASSTILQQPQSPTIQHPSHSPAIFQQEDTDDFQGYVGYVAQEDDPNVPSYSSVKTEQNLLQQSMISQQPTTFLQPAYTTTVTYGGPAPPFAGIPGYSQFYQGAYQPSLYAPIEPSSSLYAPEDPTPTRDYGQLQVPQPHYQQIPEPVRYAGSMHVREDSESPPHHNYKHEQRYDPKITTTEVNRSPSALTHKMRHQVSYDPLESASAPAYVPTPIEKTKKKVLQEKSEKLAKMLEMEKEKLAKKVAEKKLKRSRPASPSGEFSVLDKPALPVDLADDEILNPVKRDAAIFKAAEEYKKKKMEKPVVKPSVPSKKSSVPLSAQASVKEGAFRIPKKSGAPEPTKVSKTDSSAPLTKQSRKEHPTNDIVDRLLKEEARITTQKAQVKKPVAAQAKLQSVNEYVKKVAEIDKKIQQIEDDAKVEKIKNEKSAEEKREMENRRAWESIVYGNKKSSKPSSKPEASTSKKAPEQLDIDALFMDDDEPPALPQVSKKSTKPDILPEINQNKDLKVEAKSFYGKETAQPSWQGMPLRVEASSSSSSIVSNGKVRVAHNQSAQRPMVVVRPRHASAQEQLKARMEKLAASSGQVTEPALKKPRLEESHRERAVAATVPKGEARKAHAPSTATASTLNKPKANEDSKQTKPVVPLDMTNHKVPLAIRTRYLKFFYDEFVKQGVTKNEAVTLAQHEEKTLLDRCTGKVGYLSSVASSLKRLRDEMAAQPKQSGSSDNDSISHSSIVLLGRHAQNISVGIHRRSRTDEGLPEEDFYDHLRERYLLTDQQLESNCYPLWEDESKTKVKFAVSDRDTYKMAWVDDLNFQRICCRCGKQYRITKQGNFVSEDDCIYHWGKPWKKKINGAWDTSYTCCGADLTVKGCVYGECHVSQSLRKSVLSQFIETPPQSGPNDPRSKKVYSMDCEMVYTTWGPEVARVSMVDYNDEIVLDEIIRPDSFVLDTNQRFSGLTVEDVEGATYTLEQIRLKLFEFVNSETILIGHSLESDLKAMRIVHKSVVDTGVVFPHRLGPPYKRALKTLTAEFLQKIIQEEETGHDSKEDASSCLKLMIYKVKHD